MKKNSIDDEKNDIDDGNNNIDDDFLDLEFETDP